jgi:hypothetical protein
MTDGERRTEPPVYVSVIGGYEVSEETLTQAEEVGRLLARRGAIVVTGGRTGVAAAASKGAFEAGGTTVGILPGRDRSDANPYLSVAVATGIGETRNALVVMNGDAVIAFDGKFGTLTEIAHALLAGTPVIGLGTWRFEPAGDGDVADLVRVGSAAEAVDAALAAVERRWRGG